MKRGSSNDPIVDNTQVHSALEEIGVFDPVNDDACAPIIILILVCKCLKIVLRYLGHVASMSC